MTPRVFREAALGRVSAAKIRIVNSSEDLTAVSEMTGGERQTSTRQENQTDQTSGTGLLRHVSVC